MTYLRANKRPGEKKSRIAYSIIGFVVLILIAIQFVFPHFIPSIFTSIFKPFWTSSFSLSAGSLNSRESLLLQNEELKRIMGEYEVRLNTIGAIEQENDSLKEILGRPDQKNSKIVSTSSAVLTESGVTSSSSESTAGIDYSFIRQNINGRTLAAVLMRPPFTGYDEYIVDIGKDFGLKVNNKVYAPGDVLIGRVADVLEDTSKVVLYSSPGQKYEVIVGANNDTATAIGRGGGQYEVILSRDAVVKDGDFVIAPSISDKPFGVVTAVLSDPAEPFATVLFASTVNIYNMRWVLVQTSI